MKFLHLKTCFLQFAASMPALLSVLSGACHLGWTSPALQQLLSNNSNYAVQLTSVEGSWFVSIISIGSLFGLIAMILIANLIGRKPVLILLIMPMLFAWLLIIFTRNVYILYVARFIGGFGMGMCATMVPIYTGEIASDNLRSALSSSFQIMLAAGPIFEYAIVPYTSITGSAIISLVPPLIVLMTVYWMPESPYYLLMKNNEKGAHNSLLRLRDVKDVESELKIIRSTVQYQMANKTSFKELFTRKANLHGLFIMFGIYTIQAFCGTVVILFYAHVIFEKINTDISTNVLALIMIIIPCVSSFISTCIVEYFGKKPLLIVSTGLCFVTMFCVGIYFHLTELNYNVTKWLPVISLISFKFVHGLGIAGIPFIQLGEFFAANIKIYAVCTCKGYLFMLHFIGNRLYQIISDNFGFYMPFYIFSGFSLFGVVFVWYFVPETTGKSLHEIQMQLGAKYNEKPCHNEKTDVEFDNFNDKYLKKTNIEIYRQKNEL